MRTSKSALLALAALALPACVRVTQPIVSTTSLGSYEWPVGLSQGTSTATYIFGFGPIGDDSVGQAVARAIGHEGDALLNTTVDRRITYFPAPFLPIVTRIDTRVFGTVVVYIDDDGNEILGSPSEESGEQTSLRRVEPEPVRPAFAVPAAPAGHFATGGQSATATLPAPALDPQRDNVGNDDFLTFFETLRPGAVVDLRLADGRQVGGSFSRVEPDHRTVVLGDGLFGTRSVDIAAIREMRSRTIRGEAIVWRRPTP
jgi:hypothetical protein